MDKEEMFPASVRENLHGEIFFREDGDGEVFPDGEFSVAILSYVRGSVGFV
jgi:hypothetical protein